METGIYEIKNTVNGKWYRGQVQSDYGFEKRWSDHKCLLNRKKHKNKHLQSAWNKYGENAFEFTILSRCAPDFCDELEAYWIGDDYNNPAVSYNKIAGGGTSGLRSEETRTKISAAKKGWKPTQETRKNMQRAQSKSPFTVTWRCGKTKRFMSIREATKVLNVSRYAIYSYLHGKTEPGGNHRTAHLKNTIFKYEDKPCP